MNYSFNTDYSSLSGADISFDIYNINLEEIITENTPASANSIYTGNLGGIYAVPNFNTAENNLSAFHKYEAPGNYPITLVVSNSGGYLLKAYKNYVLNVKDPVPDKIFLTYNSPIQNESESTVIFYITRFNSLNTSKDLSANDYKINLSTMDNNSPIELEENYLNNKNFQYENKSFFFTSPDKNFEVIENIKTNSTFIYGKLLNGELVLSTLSADDNILVGTSGYGSSRYFEPTF